jgi:N-acetylglucosaminyldiphosphoundecaprenol N-acetyl-beta-D-mannosaminyltransferase
MDAAIRRPGNPAGDIRSERRKVDGRLLDEGKRNVLGILIDAVDYEAAVQTVFEASRKRRSFAVSALAVHGLMTGVLDPEHKFRLNHFDLLVPDGQPVRWMLNWLYHTKLYDRVYGPNLTLKICIRAASEGLPVYFYGSTPEVLVALKESLATKVPGLVIAGMEASRFRKLTTDEKSAIADRIRSSGACLVFAGLVCPKQEVFAYEFCQLLSMPVIAIGAAFPFLAGFLPQAPQWMQNAGLEWFFRLTSEPKRLWRRYLFLNTAYVFLAATQALGISRFSTDGKPPVSELLHG